MQISLQFLFRARNFSCEYFLFFVKKLNFFRYKICKSRKVFVSLHRNQIRKVPIYYVSKPISRLYKKSKRINNCK